jgi:hypothetical protein
MIGGRVHTDIVKSFDTADRCSMARELIANHE